MCGLWNTTDLLCASLQDTETSQKEEEEEEEEEEEGYTELREILKLASYHNLFLCYTAVYICSKIAK